MTMIGSVGKSLLFPGFIGVGCAAALALPSRYSGPIVKIFAGVTFCHLVADSGFYLYKSTKSSRYHSGFQSVKMALPSFKAHEYNWTRIINENTRLTVITSFMSICAVAICRSTPWESRAMRYAIPIAASCALGRVIFQYAETSGEPDERFVPSVLSTHKLFDAHRVARAFQILFYTAALAGSICARTMASQ